MKNDINNHLDQDQYGSGIKALFRSFKLAFIALVIIISTIVVWFFTFEGYFTVAPNENVIHLRFGKLIAVHEDGAHWSFGLTDELIHVPTNLQRLTINSFMRADNPLQKGENLSPLIPGVDGYLLTGDENIIHTSWKVEYRIVNPKAYYLNTSTPRNIELADDVLFDKLNNRKVGTRGPKTILKSIFENVIVSVTSTQNVQNTLYNTNAYVALVKAEFIKALNKQKYNLGVEVGNVILESNTPPAGTKAAFEDVLNAAQERSSLLHEALTYKVNVENKTISEASRIKSNADAYRIKMVSEVKSESIYFKKIYEQYKKNPKTILIALYNDVLGDALAKSRTKFLIKTNENGEQEIRLQLNKRPKKSPKNKEQEVK